jgi:hypothetical protein
MKTTNGHQTSTDERARRRRPLLLSLTATGAVVGLLAVAGVFAVSTDRATTGQNRFETEEFFELPDFDLVVAQRAPDGTCGEFSDDLLTGIMDATVDGDASLADPVEASICLKNAGAEAGEASVMAIDVVDRDLACTGFEAEVDVTCGDDQEGELSSALSARFEACDDPEGMSMSLAFAFLVDDPQSLGTLAPGETLALCFEAEESDNDIPGVEGRNRSAQSDELTWRFAFDLGERLPCVAAPLDAEPNGAAAEAIPLVVDAPMVGSICPEDDVDWYRIETTGTGGMARVTVEAPISDGDLDVQLLDLDEAIVDLSETVDDTEVVSISNDFASAFYVVVYGYRGATHPGYTISFTYEAP